MEPPQTQRQGYYDGLDLMAPAYDEKEREEERRRLKEDRERRRIENKKKKKKKRKPHPVLLLILSAIVATSLLGIAVYWFANTYLEDLIDAVQNSSQADGSMQAGVTFSQDAQEADNGKVANFVGSTWDSIEENAALDLVYEFVTVEGHSTEFDKGVVYEQSPKAGESLVEGSKTRITLYVSEGSELVEMPEVVGKPREEVETLLTELKIPYQPIEVVGNYESGVIVKCNKNPGDKIDITRGEKVLLYVKKEGFGDSSDSEDEEEAPRSSRVRSSSRSSAEDEPSSAASSRKQVTNKETSSYPGMLKPRL